MGDNSTTAPDAAPSPACWADQASAPPGTDSLIALAALDPVVIGGLSGGEMVDALIAVDRAQSLLAARRMQLLAALAVPFSAGDPMRLAARLARKHTLSDSDEQVAQHVPLAAASLAGSAVAAALGIPTVTAGIQVATAQDFTGRLAPTLAALESGRIDAAKARIVHEHTATLTGLAAGTVQQLVLPTAHEATRSEFRDQVATAVIIADPKSAQERHEAAAEQRSLALSTAPDAMANLRAYLPADAGIKIAQICDLIATQTTALPGDRRGIATRRVDALADLADRLLTHGHLDLRAWLGHPLPDPTGHPEDHPASASSAGIPAEGTHSQPSAAPGQTGTRQGRRPHLTVTIAATTLAGADDLPALLAGFGPIPAGLARAIAASAATITALATDPATGAAVAAGELQYRPRQDLRDRTTALRPTCTFPSCRQPAWRCDLDHRDRYDQEQPDRGGPTSLENLHPLCRRHHLTKHHTDWRVHPEPDQLTLHWTSPTGHHHTSRPRPATVPDPWLTTAALAGVPAEITVDVRTGSATRVQVLERPAHARPVPEVDHSIDISDLEQGLVDLLLIDAINHPGDAAVEESLPAPDTPTDATGPEDPADDRPPF
ncbi:HNH endonuclease signature motif containing protein [Nakamurella leprariae]|uniref:DUF222 domain-containing protein n=1 Tax=Nakamurella leprariae TaxID=2803911 RepID=A0A938YH26_9ACTN|nr:HNH endonuclease signature motif containing protein [Nakamurella leprariae]MBM9467984.1 DUF222 domain-containing protein [Nakamurella leprariae]